jgi:hypothetical protein
MKTKNEQSPAEQHDPATTMMLWWTIIGTVGLSFVYLFARRSGDAWHTVNALGIVVGVYLIALVLFVLRKPIRLFPRIVVGIFAFAVIGVTAFVWLRAQTIANERLQFSARASQLSMRSYLQSTMWRTLMETFRQYYAQHGIKKESVGAIFGRLNDGVSVGSNIAVPYSAYAAKIVVDRLEPSRIVLIGRTFPPTGKDAHFKNFDGDSGMVQERFTLTEKGMSHESEN